MAVGEIHVGDIGTIFRITIRDEDETVIDVSTASSLQLKFRKPETGDIITKTASFYTDGTDGIVQWATTSADDLDESGIWSIQGKVTVGSLTHHSDIAYFQVYDNLE